MSGCPMWTSTRHPFKQTNKQKTPQLPLHLKLVATREAGIERDKGEKLRKRRQTAKCVRKQNKPFLKQNMSPKILHIIV